MNNFFGLLPIIHSPSPHPEVRELHALELEKRLKRQALLFDKIGIYDWEPESESIQSINWLIEQQVLFKVSDEIKPEFYKIASSEVGAYLLGMKNSRRELLKELLQDKRWFKKLENEIKKIPESDMHFAIPKAKSALQNLAQEVDNYKRKYYRYTERLMSFYLRISAMQMEMLDNVSAIPLLSFADYSNEIPITRRNNVIEVVINKLPLPSATTPWEAILDYRNDNDTQKSLRALRNWMRNIASKDLPAREIEDELESLMDEFDNHMKLHKLKADTEVLQTLVKAPLGLIENLLRVKPTQIVEPLFVFRKRQISLMEAEINAPGKEIAYIFKANETFYDEN